MSDTVHDVKTFSSLDEAAAYLQTVSDPYTIIIITPPPH
jgi:hypothetical protein